MWECFISSTWGRWSGVTIGGDLAGLLFGASDSELETSDRGRLQSAKVFGVATYGSGSVISSGCRVALRGSGVAEAPGWTLGVVDFSREALVDRTRVIILMRVKF